ncbi:MAG: phage holin family protein [Nocardioides sp.]
MTDPTTRQTEEPLGAVVHRLSEQIPELVRSEIRLAQAELTQKGKAAGLGLGMFGASGLLAFLGLEALVATAIIAIAVALPAWAAALIVTVALFAGAGIVALLGKNKVTSATPAKPELAMEGVREDITVMKGGRHD